MAVKADKLLPFVPSIALDAAQQPAIGYFSHGTDESVIATFWRPGDKNATVIASSGGYADAQASLSLAFKGQAPRAAVMGTGARRRQSGHHGAPRHLSLPVRPG